MAYQLLNTASMAKYNPNQYTRQASGAVVLNQGVTPIAGTFRELGPQATLAKSPTDRIAVTVGTPQAQKAFGQGYQLEQKIPGPSQIPSFTQTNKMGDVLYGIKKPLSTADLSGQAGNLLPEARAQNMAVAEQNGANDINNFESAINDIYSSIKSERSALADLYRPGEQEAALGTQLADVQKAGTGFALETQQLQSAEDFNPNKLTSQIGKSQAQIARERSFKSQEYKLEEANLINRLGLAQDARKAELEGRKFGLQSLLDDANLAFKVQERVDQQAQQALQNAQSLQGAALQKATLAMNAFKEGLVSGKNAEAIKSSLSLLLAQAGIDPKISGSMFDAIQSGVEFDRVKDLATLNSKSSVDTQIVNIGGRQLLINKRTGETIQDLGSAGSTVADLTPAQQSAAFKLSDDYVKASGDYKKQVDAYNRIVASAKDPSAAGDLSLIFAYMKMLDPGSVVREGEFATAQNSGSVPEMIRARYNKVISGERLTTDIRNDFLNRANKLYSSATSQQKKVDTDFANKANKFGIPPDLILQEQGSFNEVIGNEQQGPQISVNMSYGSVSDLTSKQPEFSPIVEQLKAKGIKSDKDILQYIDATFGQPFNSPLSKGKKGSYLASYGPITSDANGSPYWKWGLDVDLKRGDPVYSPVSGKVVLAKESGGFGNRVGIQTPNGNIVYLSHLDSFKVKLGQVVSKGSLVALGGNTGKTIAGRGGDGSHLDITVKRPNGSFFTPEQIKQRLS